MKARTALPGLVLLIATAAVTSAVGIAVSEEATTPSPASEFDRKAATYIAFADRDCAEWAALFTANGTALSPTTPLAVGKVELEATCEGVLSAFATLHPILSHTIGPSSYVSGANYQAAIVWTVNGTFPGGEKVFAPAVTYVELSSPDGLWSAATDVFVLPG